VKCGWRNRRARRGPCLPSPAEKPPAAGLVARDQTRGLPNARAPQWVRRAALYPHGHDWTGRFPLIARAALSLKAASCLIDSEAVACDDDGLPTFERLRGRRNDRYVFLYAFDLIELNGDDLRHEPIELMCHAKPGLMLNEHIKEPGDVVFRHACKLGLEGIVSKRLGSPYRSGRSRDWIKSMHKAFCG
jgi:bifunctional non-homologous end joining protein LigD